jgi:hypothetical protein
MTRATLTRGRIVIGALLGALTAAPTAGDIGGCGRDAELLDVDVFARARKEEDCRRCNDCGIGSDRCRRSCDDKELPVIEIPQTCKPLRRDGEVCLRALRAASCDDYEGYARDEAPSTPSECQFCRVSVGGAPPAFADGGAE